MIKRIIDKILEGRRRENRDKALLFSSFLMVIRTLEKQERKIDVILETLKPWMVPKSLQESADKLAREIEGKEPR